jgi:hypothetical protein
MQGATLMRQLDELGRHPALLEPELGLFEVLFVFNPQPRPDAGRRLIGALEN